MSSPTQTAGAPAATPQVQEGPGLLDKVIAATRPQSDREAERAKGILGTLLKEAVKPGQVISKDVETNIKFWITEIDKKLSAQLNEVIHAPEFQKLEGTWRGLHYL